MRGCRFWGAALLGEHFGKFLGRIHQHIRRIRLERMRGKTVTHAHGPQAGVLSGFDIDVRVADDRGFFRTDTSFFDPG